MEIKVITQVFESAIFFLKNYKILYINNNKYKLLI